ncbi:MAG: ATP-binding cassette domain-containing protein, partial [Clostridia bacterium]
WELMDSHPYDLSGGEQQRAALGKVLMQRPRLLLLDEPAKGLDAVNKEEIEGIIRAIAREGAAVVIVTHDTEMAAKISHTCAMLFDGELVSLASPEEFFSENIFYTTPAAKISRGHFKNAVTAERVTALCRLNGERYEQ